MNYINLKPHSKILHCNCHEKGFQNAPVQDIRVLIQHYQGEGQQICSGLFT